MGVLAGPFSAAAILLAVGGAPKLVRPGSTAGALASLRLPASPRLVRFLGAAEVAIAVWALLTGARLAAVAMALAYAGFAVFVGVALALPGLVRSCGCFGRPDTPPTTTHLVVNIAAAGVAAAVAIGGGGRLGIGSPPLLGLPLVALTALCAWFGYLALALLPRTSARAYRA
jgi:hypothetical protein